MLEPSPWPLISIVTPSYNQGVFIEETIRSVLLQAYPNLEYVIVDGGSTDESIDIIKKYEPWLANWISEPDGGQAEAINKGFSRSTGELLGFINSDDVYAPGALHDMAATWMEAGRPNDALICGSVQDMSAEGMPLPQIFEPKRMGSLKEWLFGGISLHQPGCFWTAHSWNKFGPFPEDLRYLFDRYFFSKISASGQSNFLISNGLIAFFRLHPGSKTMSQAEEFAAEWRAAIGRLRTDLSYRHRLAVSWFEWEKRNWEFSNEVLAERDRHRARRLLIRHIVRNPASLLLRPVLGATRRLAFPGSP